jgi:hypothetical protein
MMQAPVTAKSMLRIAAIAGALVLGVAAPVAPQGQTDTTSVSPAPRPGSAPFRVGERAEYRVGYGVLRSVGYGSMEISRIDTVRGHRTYHTRFRLRGGLPGARVNNTFESWLDVRGLFSRRFEQETHEVRFHRRRTREFYPEELRWTGRTNDIEETGTLPTGAPLDDTSFLYFVRTLDLDVGREYVFHDYWNPEGNPVRIKVLRRETVTVPAGTFNTVVLQPLVRTSGLFSEGGEAEVVVSDDPSRILVMIRAKVTFGSLRLELQSYTPGA